MPLIASRGGTQEPLNPSPPRTGDRYREFQAKYFDDPAGFVRDCIIFPKGEGPAPYQFEILDEFRTSRRISVRGPHGLGKTALAAWIVHWFALTRDGLDWKMPTTASAWQQLTKFLWPEIHKWIPRLRWDQIGRPPYKQKSEILDLSIKLGTGSAFAIASDKPTSLEGAHGDHMIYLLDEGKAIPDAIFDSVEGAFSTKTDIWAVLVSTPGDKSGRFYKIQTRQPGYSDWWVRHVTMQECIAANGARTAPCISGACWATSQTRRKPTALSPARGFNWPAPAGRFSPPNDTNSRPSRATGWTLAKAPIGRFWPRAWET